MNVKAALGAVEHQPTELALDAPVAPPPDPTRLLRLD
jgi:hypothetical protein